MMPAPIAAAKHPQTDLERVQVLLNLLAHIKTEAAELITRSGVSSKKVTFTELETHIHLLRRTLDSIERHAKR